MAPPIHPPTHRVAVSAVIVNDAGQVLVSRRVDNGWFNLPGGGVEPHESVAEGLIREVREETTLAIEIGRLIGVYSKPQKREVVLTFEARVVGGTPEPTDEADFHMWIDHGALDMIKILPKHRERIEDAFRGGPAAIVRDQRAPSVSMDKNDQSGRI
jgi:ADP-ribose pyrophosphatase YjhB (NUDIX family)